MSLSRMPKPTRTRLRRQTCLAQLDAALSVLQAAVDNPTPFAALVATDSWTITVTAP
ncbi:MAG: hypothetical protein ABSA96_10595 [Candidatus Acidiferrales bacterium]